MLYLVLGLVLAAFGLLIAALTTANTLFAWLSVAVSVIAAGLLILDWLGGRRRARDVVEEADPAGGARPEQPFGDQTPPLTETAKSGRSRAGSTGTKSRRADLSRDDPSQPDLSRDDPLRTDPSRDDLVPTDLSQDDPFQDDPFQTDLSRDDPLRTDLSRDDLVRTEPSRSEPSRADLRRSDPAGADLVQTDPTRDDLVRDDQDQDDPARTDLSRDNLFLDDPVRDDSVRDDSAAAAVADGTHRADRPDRAAGRRTEQSVRQSEAEERGEPGEEETDAADLLVVTDLRFEVRVVDEHPRYHLAACTYLLDKPTLPLPVAEARQLGFTPCVRCGPDATLAARHRATR